MRAPGTGGLGTSGHRGRGAGSMASWVLSPPDRASAAVTRSQWRAPGFPGLCSSPGARPARAGHRPPGLPHSPLRSPRQNIPANCGRWPAPRTPAPTPSSLLLPSPGALAAVASPRASASLLLPQPRRSPLSRGRQSRAVQAAASRASHGAKRDANLQRGRRPLARAPGLSAQKSSRRLARDPGKDTENPRPGTPDGHYRVQRQERGKNTQAGEQSILGTVVLPSAAGERSEASKKVPRSSIMGVVVRPPAEAWRTAA